MFETQNQILTRIAKIVDTNLAGEESAMIDPLIQQLQDNAAYIRGEFENKRKTVETLNSKLNATQQLYATAMSENQMIEEQLELLQRDQETLQKTIATQQRTISKLEDQVRYQGKTCSEAQEKNMVLDLEKNNLKEQMTQLVDEIEQNKRVFEQKLRQKDHQCEQIIQQNTADHNRLFTQKTEALAHCMRDHADVTEKYNKEIESKNAMTEDLFNLRLKIQERDLEAQLLKASCEQATRNSKQVYAQNKQMSAQLEVFREAERHTNQSLIDLKSLRTDDEKTLKLLQDLCAYKNRVAAYEKLEGDLRANETELKRAVEELRNVNNQLVFEKNEALKEAVMNRKLAEGSVGEELNKQITELRKIAQFKEQEAKFYQQKYATINEYLGRNLNRNAEDEPTRLELLKTLTELDKQKLENRRLKRELTDWQLAGVEYQKPSRSSTKEVHRPKVSTIMK